MGKIHDHYQKHRLQQIANEHFANPENGHRREGGQYELTEGSLQRLTEAFRGGRRQGSIIGALEAAMKRIEEQEAK